ncbi:MAG: hypothetical protein IPJ84_03200 [Bdellovibrionales bacterium]|nr:hypothetical protein [Bdellovibrionales bacterium]
MGYDGLLQEAGTWTRWTFFVPNWGVDVFLGLGMTASLGVLTGYKRRPCAIFIWLSLVLIFARNALIKNVATDYVGWLLLASVFVPTSESIAGASPNKDEEFSVPPILLTGAWFVLTSTYTMSGLYKLSSEFWRTGLAVGIILNSYVGRAGSINEMICQMPWLTYLMTWSVVFFETVAFVFFFKKAWRWALWLATALMHASIGVLTTMSDLSMSVLLFHLFLLDPKWIEWIILKKRRHSRLYSNA